jgi:hypothetical protein
VTDSAVRVGRHAPIYAKVLVSLSRRYRWLSWFAFATANKPIGITTAFEYTAGLTEKAATPELAEAYLQALAEQH